MKRLLVFIWAFAPLLAFATDETCPAGYQPEEYIELEYIESTGTQWIDTGIILNQDSEVELKYQGLKLKTQTALFGARTTYKEMTYSSSLCGSETYDKIDVSYYDRNNFFGTVDLSVHTLKRVANVSYFDDIQVFVSPKINFETPVSLYVFGINNNGSAVLTSSLRVYHFNVKGVDGTIKQLIPVKRLSDGAVGMFDKVEGKFYGNSGTGEFIAGPEIAHDTITTQHHICVTCPANTYKPNTGNESCTKCPTGTFSPIGSTSRSDCAKILRINDYVVYMPLGKRTEHGLCVMWNGEKYCADVYKKQ